ncbi:hypothetical protein MARI151_50237 [Maribacter litoralis]|uniref:Uncharacterized protein n=1 Tax=Maribacter litoralis TaxID=2059726 RepID=A0A653URD1_9FLAO|nr:hypothetical protein MARI151_50237 [Maribacter litoralis]
MPKGLFHLIFLFFKNHHIIFIANLNNDYNRLLNSINEYNAFNKTQIFSNTIIGYWLCRKEA